MTRVRWKNVTFLDQNRQNIGILVFNQNFSPINPPKPPKKSPPATQYLRKYSKSKKKNIVFAIHDQVRAVKGHILGSKYRDFGTKYKNTFILTPKCYVLPPYPGHEL